MGESVEPLALRRDMEIIDLKARAMESVVVILSYV